MQLFLQCALAADRTFVVDAEATQTVARICRALDGLPLAIELAASRSHSLTPAQIAEQLAQPLSIGEHALRDLPDRQQTLEATIRWSYDLLTPAGAPGAGQRRRVPGRVHAARRWRPSTRSRCASRSTSCWRPA